MKSNTAKHVTIFAIVTVLILLIPLAAMQFTSEVDWGVADFIFMGVLLFGSGLTYELITRNMKSRWHRVMVGVVVAFMLLFIWVGAATGFEGLYR